MRPAGRDYHASELTRSSPLTGSTVPAQLPSPPRFTSHYIQSVICCFALFLSHHGIAFTITVYLKLPATFCFHCMNVSNCVFSVDVDGVQMKR